MLTNPRAASDADFPRDGSPEDQLRAMIAWAVLAPSVFNTQPWRFVVDGPTVALHADRDRQLLALDPSGREMVVSCGAALYTLRLTARHFGFLTMVERPADHPTLVARLRLAGRAPATDHEERLFHAVKNRHTNRHPFAPLPLSPHLVDALVAAASQERADLHLLDAPDARARLAALVGEALRRQGDDPETMHEIERWLRPARDPRPDGVPNEVQPPWGLFAGLRTSEAVLASRTKALAEQAPALLVLTTPGDTPVDWARAGEALQHVLLLATTHDLAASYLNPPIEVEALRPEVSALCPSGHAQVVLRMGWPESVDGTPRRSARDVTTSG